MSVHAVDFTDARRRGEANCVALTRQLCEDWGMTPEQTQRLCERAREEYRANPSASREPGFAARAISQSIWARALRKLREALSPGDTTPPSRPAA